MEAQRPTPCPWLLDASGAIDHGRPRTPSRCGADPARGELSNQIRERRCLAGSACEIRDAREAALGPLAAALAPRQPVGDAERYALALESLNENLYDWDIVAGTVYFAPGLHITLGIKPEQMRAPKDWIDRRPDWLSVSFAQLAGLASSSPAKPPLIGAPVTPPHELPLA